MTTESPSHHSELIAWLRQKAPLSFSEFMHDALYLPGLGYYSSGQQKFGPAGDFITAPDYSPLFSESLAQMMITSTAAMQDMIILELGAGSGQMALNSLRALARQDALPKAYWILELSAELQQRQRALFETHIPELCDRIHFLHALPEQPFEGIIVANEVMDAMPVARFKMDNHALKEAMVIEHEGLFSLDWQPASASLTAAVSKLNIAFEDGYESEINLALGSWIDSLARTLTRGYLVLIDYGFSRAEYYHPDRHMGTLMCYHGHRAYYDPLVRIGEQDITAHVDFTAVAEAAIKSNLSVLGYTTQSAFLLENGILDHYVQTIADQPRADQARFIKQLLFPSEMGELFKVIALGKHKTEAPTGFQQTDLLHML